MKFRAYEIKNIKKDEDGHIIVTAHDFFHDKDETLILTEADQKKLKELLK